MDIFPPNLFNPVTYIVYNSQSSKFNTPLSLSLSLSLSLLASILYKQIVMEI